MGRDRNDCLSERDELEVDRKSKGKVRETEGANSPDAGDRKSDGQHRRKRLGENSSDSDSEEEERKRRRKGRGRRESRKRRSGRSDESDSEYSDSESSESGSEGSEEERKRKKRREKRKRREREEEKDRKRRRREREKEKEREKRKKEKRKKEKKKKEKERGKTGAVTNSWGKYGIIRETDMWNKRPEFSAWLAEVRQVNLETLPNWEEKQMFKEFMEDHNTATFPSKKYYNLDAYYKRQMLKELKSGQKVRETERTIFNDEELKRQEQMREREKQKEQEVQVLKRAMQSGMAQAMKEQAQLREEMAYQYKVGNHEAAAAIQRRLDPDAAV